MTTNPTSANQNYLPSRIAGLERPISDYAFQRFRDECSREGKRMADKIVELIEERYGR